MMFDHKSSAVVLTAILTIVSTGLRGGSVVGSELRVVALTGQPAPGTDPGVYFSDFGNPVLNDQGRTAFRASVAGTGVDSTNAHGLWSEGTGTMRLTAREGQVAPDLPGPMTFGNLSPEFEDEYHMLHLNNAGQLAFHAIAREDFSGTWGIWSDREGDLRAVAYTRQPVPEIGPDVRFAEDRYAISQPVVNDAGQVAFRGKLANVSGYTSTTTWLDRGTSRQLVIREGDPVPGIPNSSFGTIDAPERLNAAGQMVFYAQISGGAGSGVTSDNDDVVWIGGSDGLQMLVREGDPAPELADGVIARNPHRTASLNDAGEGAFEMPLAGPGVEYSNNTAIYTGSPGNLRLVARRGDRAPGTPEDVRFIRFGLFSIKNPPALNNHGQTAFRATLTGTDEGTFGVWSEGGGSLGLVARTGDRAPGTPDAVVFDRFDPPMINDLGQTAFYATVEGAPWGQGGGIWAQDPDGALQLIARAGDTLELEPDDRRTIAWVGLDVDSGYDERYAFGFNDLGQVAFFAALEDGSKGIFVSNTVAVPEPSTVVLLSLGAAGLLMSAWRRGKGRRGSLAREAYSRENRSPNNASRLLTILTTIDR